jgi:large subunit ribosomal protein L30
MDSLKPLVLNNKLYTKVMKKIKITLVKSPIDRPERQKLTLEALGLNKMNSSREVEATPQMLGMIRTVEHLLQVEENQAQ